MFSIIISKLTNSVSHSRRIWTWEVDAHQFSVPDWPVLQRLSRTLPANQEDGAGEDIANVTILQSCNIQFNWHNEVKNVQVPVLVNFIKHLQALYPRGCSSGFLFFSLVNRNLMKLTPPLMTLIVIWSWNELNCADGPAIRAGNSWQCFKWCPRDWL